jgi:hypothetical protein
MKGQTMAAASEGMGEGPTAPHPFAKAQFEQPGPVEDEDDPAEDEDKNGKE